MYTSSMKRLILSVATIALFACQREITPANPPAKATTTAAARPQNLGKARVNEVLPMNGAESLVQSHLDKDTYKAGEPVTLTMTLRDAPKGVELRAQWFDAKGKQIGQDKKELMGQNTATFTWSGKPLKPGKYRVVSYWGENIAGDHNFVVTK